MGALHRPQRQLLRAADQRLTPTALLGALALLWGGMLLGISFLEAWVKFRAPSLSLSEGLDVGRHVFGALNAIELVWATVAVALIAVARPPRALVLAVVAAVAIVGLQTAWLLPVLDERVATVLAGGDPPAAPYHVLYIALEAVKLGVLLLVGGLVLRSLLPPPRSPS